MSATGVSTFRSRLTTREDLSAWRAIGSPAATAVISHYFGRTGVIIAFGIAALPVIYIHAIWLPGHGVNGWTGEPGEKYYALRGWVPPDR